MDGEAVVPGPVRSSYKVATASTLQWLNGKAVDRGFSAILPEEIFHQIDWEGEHRCAWVQDSPGYDPPHVLTAWRIQLSIPSRVDPPGALDRLIDPPMVAQKPEVVDVVEAELCIEHSDYDALPAVGHAEPHSA
jgi:hypothetical protein